MDHCRGFIKGIIRGCLVGPVACVAFAGLLILIDFESVRNELGPVVSLLGWAFQGLPLGAVAGGFIGAIHDALRIRDVERWIVVICLLPIFLVFFVLPVVSWIR